MSFEMNRRRMLYVTGGALTAGACGIESTEEAGSTPVPGAIAAAGTEYPVAVGEAALCCGNAVDTAVTAALTAGVTELPACGISGYGGHMVIAMADGRITAIDYNSVAPAAMRRDLFTPDANGAVPDAHDHGWLSAGVPGTIAGMQLALEKYGTKTFTEALQPAIKAAREGFEIPETVAGYILRAQEVLTKDPASQRLLFPGGNPLTAGALFRNPELADVLETLAEANSVEPFYRGDIGEKIAQAFQDNGGILTASDMEEYAASEVEPVHVEWCGYDIYTAPLTAGGATSLEAVNILKALGWENLSNEDEQNHARLEALRIAWRDRLTLFGDPAKVDVPLGRLMSDSYAERMAERVRQAINRREPQRIATQSREQNGTVHISCVDAAGNMVAMTLTHGVNFGARVTVDGLGLILGHGMSRFDPNPRHPNSPGSRKKPLHNMCPTIVMRDGKPVLAVGGRGGRRIPSAIVDVLVNYVGLDRTMEESIDAPRMVTQGGLNVQCDDKWSEEGKEYLAQIGYEVSDSQSARMSAAAVDPSSGATAAVWR